MFPALTMHELAHRTTEVFSRWTHMARMTIQFQQSPVAMMIQVPYPILTRRCRPAGTSSAML